MRLPWLQIDADGQTRARLLGRLLRIPETQGMGIALALWTWALERSPDGDFSGKVNADEVLLAAAVSWPANDAERLITELDRVGFIALEPDFRVRGLDRYRPAWEKNRRKGHGKDAGPAREEAGAALDPLATPRDPLEPGRARAGEHGSRSRPAKTRAGSARVPRASRRNPERKTETETETESRHKARRLKGKSVSRSVAPAVLKEGAPS
jgi:hypothetical protein